MNTDAAQTETQPETRPYRLLDAWRGVAALWVVLLHSRGAGLPTALDHFSLLGLLGVPLFFVIPGYCIASAAQCSASAPRPTAHCLGARARRIYPRTSSPRSSWSS